MRINISVARILKLIIFLFFAWRWIACAYWFICVIEDSLIDVDEEEHLIAPRNYAWLPPKFVAIDATIIDQYIIVYF